MQRVEGPVPVMFLFIVSSHLVACDPAPGTPAADSGSVVDATVMDAPTMDRPVTSDVVVDSSGDLGIEAAADTGRDVVTVDVGADALADALVDSGSEVGADALVDSGSEAGADALVDSGSEAGADVPADAPAGPRDLVFGTTVVTWTLTTRPNDVLPFDADHDGDADLLIPNASSSLGTPQGFTLMRNLGVSGAVTTGSLAGPVDLPLMNLFGVTPTGTSAHGDLDGDMLPDFVIPVAADFSLVNNLVTVGSAFTPTSFGTVPSLRSGGHLESALGGIAALADLDGDGKLDLISAFNLSGLCQLGVFRNTTAAPHAITFATGVQFTTANTGTCERIATGDVDGDGRIDVAFAAGTSLQAGYGIYVFRNTATPGSFTTASLAAPLVLTEPAVADWPFLALRDMNADGRADVVYSARYPAGPSLSLRQSMGAGVAFGPSIALGGAGPYQILDVNGDARVDIAITGNPTWAFLNAAPTGGALSAAAFPQSAFTYGTAGINLGHLRTLADVNADGLPDLVMINRDRSPAPAHIVTVRTNTSR